MASSKYDDYTTADSLVAEFKSEIQGKVVLVTGTSPGGLGAHFVEAIAKGSPSLIILGVRNVAKGEETAAAIKNANEAVETRTLKLDMASFESVRRAAEEVNGYPEAIDVLVNNSGIMAVPYSKTEDGFESQLQTNHLSVFLFTNLIIDKVLASGPDARIVNVSSEGHWMGFVRHFDYNFHDGESYDPWVAYGASKSATILHSSELARRLGRKGLTTVSLCPGVVVTTNLTSHGGYEVLDGLSKWWKTLGDPRGWKMSRFKKPNEGVATHTFAAFAPDVKSKSRTDISDSLELGG